MEKMGAWTARSNSAPSGGTEKKLRHARLEQEPDELAPGRAVLQRVAIYEQRAIRRARQYRRRRAASVILQCDAVRRFFVYIRKQLQWDFAHLSGGLVDVAIIGTDWFHNLRDKAV